VRHAHYDTSLGTRMAGAKGRTKLRRTIPAWRSHYVPTHIEQGRAASWLYPSKLSCFPRICLTHATLVTCIACSAGSNACWAVARWVARRSGWAAGVRRDREGRRTRRRGGRAVLENWQCWAVLGTGRGLSRPLEVTTPRTAKISRNTPRCPSVVLWTPCSNRPSRAGSGTTGKQPANLAVEGAEESLSILPDYTPTVRPPPKRS
jgi:hypothetical protein